MSTPPLSLHDLLEGELHFIFLIIDWLQWTYTATGCVKVTIHFLSSCKILASIECGTRHDSMCKQIHKEILLKNSVTFISVPRYFYRKVSSGRYKIAGTEQ